MDEIAISVRHIYKTYPGGIKAVDDVSFDVPVGSCFGFLGPNGAGKTTLMKMLFGRAKRDQHGETTVHVLGFDPDVDELAVKYLSGVVPQEDNLDMEIDVTKNLLIFSKFYGIRFQEAKDRISELLAFMELSEKAKAGIKSLSGGMKRRLIIARALLNKPRLLILDEPTTGLDPQVRQMIWDKIRGLKRNGVTVLLTTHYMEEAFQIADRILIMDHGKTVIEGVPRQLMEEGMEPYVIEIMDKARLRRIPEALTAVLRQEESAERIHFYGRDLAVLERLVEGLEPGSFLIRPTNLEDLFLRYTGRSLNDEQ